MQKNNKFEHIFYEMVMYEQTFRLLFVEQRIVYHNAIWESHIIHLRNLIDFFDKTDSPHEDDILVSRVIKETDKYALNIPQDFKDVLNKSVQHLSVFRADSLDKSKLSQEVVNIRTEIIKRILWFNRDVKESSHLKEEYKEDYEQYILEKDNLANIFDELSKSIDS